MDVSKLTSQITPAFFCVLFFFVACQPLPPAVELESKPTKPPETKSSAKSLVKPSRYKPTIKARKHMVVTANPYASRAGNEILRKGGTALDAAIAIQMVLNLVEPQSSGIGGGAFLLHYTSKTGNIDSYDGREIAPANATPDMFQTPNGNRMKFHEAVPGGLSVGVPGLLRMLEIAHQRHGKLPWKTLFESAIQLAEDGFIISPRLYKLVSRDRYLKKFSKTKKYFFDAHGAAKQAGSRLINLELAETLRKIADGGADVFYEGPIAQDIVEIVKNSKINPGRLTLKDMVNYSAKRRDPICMPYRQWFVCGMPPPTSGGVTTLQILGILQSIDIKKFKPNSIDAIHTIIEASRLAYADRNLYIGDPDFVKIPTGLLIDPEYLNRRAKLISKSKSMGKAAPGRLNYKLSRLYESDESSKGSSTSHFSVVDKNGNVVSMTATIESAFGSRLMARGFLLNNQLTDFSFSPIKKGKLVANSVWPGKRPRSSMAPTIVFNSQGKPVLVLGSPGGSRIIGYVAKSLIAVLDWKMPIQAAIELPHFVNPNSYTDIEKDTQIISLKPALERRGHQVRIRKLSSGLHGIQITNNGLEGGVDPRREGLSVGE